MQMAHYKLTIIIIIILIFDNIIDFDTEIHSLKQATALEGFNLNRSQPYDPIGPVALDISKETTLLCFDEFQVFIVIYFRKSIFNYFVLRRISSEFLQTLSGTRLLKERHFDILSGDRHCRCNDIEAIVFPFVEERSGGVCNVQ